jgi:hypothetical protein
MAAPHSGPAAFPEGVEVVEAESITFSEKNVILKKYGFYLHSLHHEEEGRIDQNT